MKHFSMQNSLPVASGPVANTHPNVDGWKSIQLDPNEDNAMVFLDQVSENTKSDKTSSLYKVIILSYHREHVKLD